MGDHSTLPELQVHRADDPRGASRVHVPASIRLEVEREALLRVAAAVAAANDLESILELVAEEALLAVGAASLSISRLEDEDSRYRALINVGRLAPDEERFPANDSHEVERFPRLRELAETGRPYFNSLDDPDCDPAAAELLMAHGKTSDLGAAIETEGRVWGGIWATTASVTSGFDSHDLRFLEAIAGQLGNAISRAQLFSKVSRLAYEDVLTGLANRRALEERLDRAFARFEHDGASLTLLLCDVDRLKTINDGSGHGAGDDVLRRVAEALVAAAADHPGAFVARLGGDEFCILLESREASREGRASLALERVAAAAQQLLASTGTDATLSCGAAAAGPGVDTPSLLLSAADTAQYMAKRRGGNRICTAAQVAEAGGDAVVTSAATPSARIAAVTDELIAAFDGDLREAPVLDRLEALAIAYTEAADFARWAISFVPHGGTQLRDISLGDNRLRRAAGVRVAPGPDDYQQYELDDYPQTAPIIAAGTGSFIARLDDPGVDPGERRILEAEGFNGVLGAAVGGADGVFLVELAGDDPNAPYELTEAPLRLAVRAAIPPTSHCREHALTDAHSRALELSLALAGRLAEATAEHEVCEAAAEETQRAFGSPVVHIVGIRGAHFEVRAERGPIGTAPGWTQRVGAGLIGRCVREGGPVMSGDVTREPQYRATPATRTIRSELAAPIMVNGTAWGVINLEDDDLDAFTPDDARLLESVAAQVGGALNAIALYESLDRAYVGTAEALSAALEAKDSYTAEHSRSIVENAAAVGGALGMDAEELRMLRYAAAFHDIGKLAVQREILNKPGPLTPEERSQIEDHTIVGERIIAPIEFLAPIRSIIRSAHERWDGGGYPDGLAGKVIPLGARILFACDAYDAMTSDRSYRPAMSVEIAREEMRACGGSQFDPEVVEALLEVLEARSEEAAWTGVPGGPDREPEGSA